MLERHKALLKKFASDALVKNGLRHDFYYEDTLSEGLLAFVEALKSYDPDVGVQFSTWLWYRLRHRIGLFLQKERRHLELQHILKTGTYIPRKPKRRAIKLKQED